MKEEDAGGYIHLKEAVKSWPFLRYVLTNIESSLVSANEALMREYASLVEDAGIRDRFMGTIATEFKRTRELMEELFEGTFRDRRPRLAYTLDIREEALEGLHRQQIALLREWRQDVANGRTQEVEAMLPDLLVSINALARSSGGRMSRLRKRSWRSWAGASATRHSSRWISRSRSCFRALITFGPVARASRASSVPVRERRERMRLLAAMIGRDLRLFENGKFRTSVSPE